MSIGRLRYVVALALAVSFAPVASASFLTCSETVNETSSVSVEQFPSTLSYDLTVTEAWCVYCAGQPSNDWCHTLCLPDGTPNGSASLVGGESDGVLAAFSKAPIPWVTTNPPWVEPFPFWLFNGESVTTNVTFTLQSYADCAQRAALAGIGPDAGTGQITIPDQYVVTWGAGSSAVCSAQVICKPPLGPTRTIGYFRTHPDAVRACVATSIDLGFLTVGAGDAATALGLLNTNPARYDDGSKRSALDQARILLGRQLLVSICNGRVFGSSPADELIPAAVLALASGTCANLSWLQGQLDAFNNSGDTGENWFGYATPATYADPTPRTGLACR